MTEDEMDADVFSQNLIRHTVPPQLCLPPPFSITMIRPPNWIPLGLYHFLCFCVSALSAPPSTHAPPLTICASLFQLSLFVPAQLSTRRLTFQLTVLLQDFATQFWLRDKRTHFFKMVCNHVGIFLFCNSLFIAIQQCSKRINILTLEQWQLTNNKQNNITSTESLLTPSISQSPPYNISDFCHVQDMAYCLHENTSA